MTTNTDGSPTVVLKDVAKYYGNIQALSGIDLTIGQGQVNCILGDNGAGKSTLIKVIAGLYRHDTGEYLVDGKAVRFSSPKDALDRGIATVYQDLALEPLMPVWRNFFLGSEKTKGVWPARTLDRAFMKRTADEELRRMGISLADLDQPVGTLSGGQRQCVAIARAIYFGARVLILDEPTAALGVKQSGVVLKYIAAARDAGLAVIFITHNPHHAYVVGDHFTVLSRGAIDLSSPRRELALEDLTHHMAGGEELEEIKHELDQMDSGDIPEVPEKTSTA